MNRKRTNKKGPGGWLPAVVLILALCLVAAVWIMLATDRWTPGAAESGTQPSAAAEAQSAPPAETDTAAVTDPAGTEVRDPQNQSLEGGLEIVRWGKYIGAYMEDGSDDFVSNVMMVEVYNAGTETIQYAAITVAGEAGEAVFHLTTLLPGARAVVLEAARKPYSETDVYTEARAEDVTYLPGEVGLQEDRIRIQPLEGGFNITNISGGDITGEIAVYFKDCVADLYYGGITYVCRIEGGLKADEVKQIMSSNFTGSGSRVMFVTIGQ